MKRAGGKLRSLQKKSICFFDHLPISALVRFYVFCHFAGFSPAICFPAALFGKSCCAWCVVFRKHSDDFLPTFRFDIIA